MKNITEFLKECRVNGDEKIDTNDDSFWKLKDLLEHYKEQCNIPVVGNCLPKKEDVASELENHLDKWFKSHTRQQNDSYALGFRHCFHYICDWIKLH